MGTKEQERNEWEEHVLREFVEQGREYEPSFFVKLLLKYLWASEK